MRAALRLGGYGILLCPRVSGRALLRRAPRLDTLCARILEGRQWYSSHATILANRISHRYGVLMVQTVVVRLTDDLDGSDADETVAFGLDGKSYQIDLNKKNAATLRKTLKTYIDKGRPVRQASTRGRRASSGTTSTLFSQLDSEEKDRFRTWASLPNARRIGDARVRKWFDAGRP